MRWLALLTAFVIVAGSASAASIQARLVRASNDKQASDASLQDLDAVLKKKIGYTRYEQLGTQQTTLDGKLQRLNVSEGFTVFVKHKSTQDKKHEVEVEWYSGKASLVKSTVTIRAGKSVLISGPAVGEQLIVLALTARD